MQSSVAPPSERLKSFAARWVTFWSKFAHTAEATGALYDEALLESVVLPWLTAISGAKLRVWRRMATLAAFALVDAGNEISVRLRARIETIETQMADPKLKKGVRTATTQNQRRSREQTRRGGSADRGARSLLTLCLSVLPCVRR